MVVDGILLGRVCVRVCVRVRSFFCLAFSFVPRQLACVLSSGQHAFCVASSSFWMWQAMCGLGLILLAPDVWRDRCEHIDASVNLDVGSRVLRFRRNNFSA